MKKNCITFILFLLLAACGFHLVGTMDLPPQLNNVYLESDLTYSPLIKGLKSSLESASVTLVNDITQADYIIELTQEQQRHALIGSATTQETRKYNIIYEVTFTIKNTAGKILYGPATLSSSATLYIYSGQVLGNNNEIAPTSEQLQREVVQKVMLKLSSQEAHDALTNTVTDKIDETIAPTITTAP